MSRSNRSRWSRSWLLTAIRVRRLQVLVSLDGNSRSRFSPRPVGSFFVRRWPKTRFHRGTSFLIEVACFSNGWRVRPQALKSKTGVGRRLGDRRRLERRRLETVLRQAPSWAGEKSKTGAVLKAARAARAARKAFGELGRVPRSVSAVI